MLNKIIKIGYWSLLGIIVILILHFFFFQFSGLQDSLSATEALATEEKVEEIANIATNWEDILFSTAIILGIITAIVTILFSLYQILINTIENKAGRKGLLITLGIAIIIVAASYFLSHESVPFILGLIEGNSANGIITDISIINEWGTTVKFIEMGLFLTYIVAGLTILCLVFGEISKMFK